MKRLRLRTTTERPKDYINLRTWWLHELRQLRAKKRISGINTNKAGKAVQRELVKIRKELK